jgi:glutathione S-transferase
MKLYVVSTSPFARKVRLVALVLDLPLDLVETPPLDDPPALLAANPLGKVPALELDDGSVLFDSPVIVQALDDMAGHRLLAPMGPERWEALRGEALADGIMEAAVGRTMELRRPEGDRSALWLGRYRRAIERGLAEAAKAPPAWPRLPALALACALEYLDLRHGDLAWRDGQPALAAWHAALADTPFLAATRP